MLPTEIFKESPFKALKILGVILGGIFLLLAVMLISDEMPRVTADGLNTSAFAMLLMMGIFGGCLLLTFLILSFQRRKTIKCDFNGFEISETNFWQSGGYAEQFKWNDVTDTNIIERVHDLGTEGAVSVYTFIAETDQKQIDLLDLKTSTKKNIEGLLDYFNKAVPHSEYFWLKNKNVGNQQAIVSVYGFSKVSRNN